MPIYRRENFFQFVAITNVFSTSLNRIRSTISTIFGTFSFTLFLTHSSSGSSQMLFIFLLVLFMNATNFLDKNPNILCEHFRDELIYVHKLINVSFLFVNQKNPNDKYMMIVCQLKRSPDRLCNIFVRIVNIKYLIKNLFLCNNK